MLNTEYQSEHYRIQYAIDAFGVHTVYLNDSKVSENRCLGSKAEHSFEKSINGKPQSFKIICKLSGITKCTLQIFEGTTEVHSSMHSLSYFSMFKRKKSKKSNWFSNEFKSMFSQVPKWSWFFIVPCLLIPIISFGGAIPAVLGIGGAGLCSAIARRKWPIAVRVILCTFITCICWFFMLIIFAAMTGGFEN